MLSKVKKSLANVLTQNPIGDYRVGERKFRGGKNNLLHIQDAVEISSGRLVSIVSLDVKEIVSRCMSAAEVEEVVRNFKDGVTLLTRLRHPNILQVVRPLMEDKKHLQIVTERITSLLSLELSNGNLSQQEKILGILRCAKAIHFIHERVGYLLCDFAPQAVCIVEGEWKVFDFSHAILGTEAMKHKLSYPFSSLAAPVLDYCATEVIKALKPNEDGPIDLFVPNVPESSVKIPESDVFSFIVVSVEVLSGERLFNCGDNIDLYNRQYTAVEKKVSKWFSGRPLSEPRPSLVSLLRERIFTTEDMLVLASLDQYDTMDENERFVLLKRVYDALGNSLFVEVLILRLIIPLMCRESSQEGRLRYTLPILLRCSQTISENAFSTHLRKYFITLLGAISKAESFDRCTVPAELVLDNFEVLKRRFSTDTERNTIIVPFLERCVDPSIRRKKIIQASMNCISQEAERGGPLHFSDSLPERLIDVSLDDPQDTTSLCLCLERVVRHLSLTARYSLESRLVCYANNLAFDTGASRDTLNRFLALLEYLYEGFSREHKATQSIPLISPLLISNLTELSLFSKRTIQKMVIEVTVPSDTGSGDQHRPPTTSEILPSHLETDFFSQQTTSSHPTFL
ncbi:Protein kinase domain [Trypanosoma melophagium]|uniref:Protein kinase domain n=1 Tax=Trypanosoma melophagium TaxID=715481 RepID=UPI00351A50FC|nr:Protein kinase domain [Trypanosoma melophagium]